MRKGLAGTVVLVILSAGMILVPSASGSPNYDRTCGVLPGNGYVNYVRVANLSCRQGIKVAHRARRKFCARHNGCPFNSDLQSYRGAVSRNGWKCKVTLGYEYERVKCRKGSRRLIHIAGA